jgi:hypothetical protein
MSHDRHSGVLSDDALDALVGVVEHNFRMKCARVKYGLFLGRIVPIVAFWSQEFTRQIAKGQLVQFLVTQTLTSAFVRLLGQPTRISGTK